MKPRLGGAYYIYSAPHFRTQLSAAPLKPGLVAVAFTITKSFPHSVECGPIEAIGTLVEAMDEGVISALS